MNDHQLQNVVTKDAEKLKKDIGNLIEERQAQVNQLEDNVSQATGKAKEDVTQWVEKGVSQLGDEFEKITGDVKETVVGTAATVKKDVGHGLSQYNAKAQEVAEKVPGGFAEKAAKYPWVAISIALLVGLVLGSLLRQES